MESCKDIRSAGFASRVGIYLARYSQCKRERGHEELGPELHVPLVPYGGNTMIANLVDVDEDRSAAQHATRLLFVCFGRISVCRFPVARFVWSILLWACARAYYIYIQLAANPAVRLSCCDRITLS